MTEPHITDVLVRAEVRYQRASDRAERMRAERDGAIRQAVGEGMSHAAIYRALDGKLTRARIGQIALEGGLEMPEPSNLPHVTPSRAR